MQWFKFVSPIADSLERLDVGTQWVPDIVPGMRERQRARANWWDRAKLCLDVSF